MHSQLQRMRPSQEAYREGGALVLFMNSKPQKRVVGYRHFFFHPHTPLPPMSTYHTGFGNGFESGSMGDLGFQPSENQGQWQFNGVWNAAATRQSAFSSHTVQVRRKHTFSLPSSQLCPRTQLSW